MDDSFRSFHEIFSIWIHVISKSFLVESSFSSLNFSTFFFKTILLLFSFSLYYYNRGKRFPFSMSTLRLSFHPWAIFSVYRKNDWQSLFGGLVSSGHELFIKLGVVTSYRAFMVWPTTIFKKYLFLLILWKINFGTKRSWGFGYVQGRSYEGAPHNTRLITTVTFL